jgi:tetratricopeptide (TPR) repeat protein
MSQQFIARPDNPMLAANCTSDFETIVNRPLHDPLNNLGWILLAKGNRKAAEPVLHEALEIRRKALGEKHPLFAASLANWARVLQAEGEYAQAEEGFRQALTIVQQANGPENWTVAKILSYQGLLRLDRGDFASAEQYAR